MQGAICTTSVGGIGAELAAHGVDRLSGDVLLGAFFAGVNQATGLALFVDEKTAAQSRHGDGARPGVAVINPSAPGAGPSCGPSTRVTRWPCTCSARVRAQAGCTARGQAERAIADPASPGPVGQENSICSPHELQRGTDWRVGPGAERIPSSQPLQKDRFLKSYPKATVSRPDAK